MAHAQRVTVTLRPEVVALTKDAADTEGVSVSEWVADSIVAKLRYQAMGEALDLLEAEVGTPTSEELAKSRKILGLASPTDHCDAA